MITANGKLSEVDLNVDRCCLKYRPNKKEGDTNWFKRYKDYSVYMEIGKVKQYYIRTKLYGETFL